MPSGRDGSSPGTATPRGRATLPAPGTWSCGSHPHNPGRIDPPKTPKPPGLLVAEAVLEANGIQDLADQVPDIAKAAVGNNLRFNLRVEFGGETAPDPETVEKINELLSEVSDKLKLA